MSDFDFEGAFDEDYLYFYGPLLGERTGEDVEKIVGLLELDDGAEILDCPCGYGRIANSLAERGFVDVRQGRRMQLRRASEWKLSSNMPILG